MAGDICEVTWYVKFDGVPFRLQCTERGEHKEHLHKIPFKESMVKHQNVFDKSDD